MWLPHWCMLGLTILLFLSEVAVSRLCTSLITMVDGFHTLFILMLMALPLPQSVSTSATAQHAPSAKASPPSTLPAESCTKDVSGKQAITTEQSSSDASRLDHHPHPPIEPSPAGPNCGLNFPSRRIHTVGLFISALLLTSLCASYLMEIVSFCLEPHPARYPLGMVVLGAAGLLHKMVMFGLNWDWLQDGGAEGGQLLEVEPHLRVLPEAESVSGKQSQHVKQLKVHFLPTPRNSLHTDAVVFYNLAAANTPDSHKQNSQPQAEVHLQVHGAELKENEIKCHLNDIPEDTLKSSDSPSAWTSDPTQTTATGDQKPFLRLSVVFNIQGLFTSLLALINSLVMLLVAPHFLHGSEACSPLIYLDPALSLLAVVTLIATTVPQLCRYGLLLLQATPSHICVSDIGRRIVSVPGVQAVHDLHIWQLTESIMVASVHVHCYSGFPLHRCSDVTSGVTKVLQRVGVTCCTVQPEFVSSSGSAVVSQEDCTPVVCREDPSPPPALICSLACGKQCAKSMCCSPPKDEHRCRPAPPPGEPREEPPALVIQNTFL